MTPRLDGVTILVVDDSEDIREVLRMILKHAGATVIAVATAEAALAMLDTVLCHAIVTDISLRGQDAFWLLEQLGARSAHLPVIVVSGHPRHGDAAGFAQWLMKPVDPGAVVGAIAAVLDRP